MQFQYHTKLLTNGFASVIRVRRCIQNAAAAAAIAIATVAAAAAAGLVAISSVQCTLCARSAHINKQLAEYECAQATLADDV